MTIESLLMAGLMAFVLLVPTLMVAVLLSGFSRREMAAMALDERADDPADLPAAA
jgi:hypothetical protein